MSQKNLMNTKNKMNQIEENLFINDFTKLNIKDNSAKKISTSFDDKINNQNSLKSRNNDFKNSNIDGPLDDNSILSTIPLEDLFLMKLDFLITEIFNNFYESSNYLNKISMGTSGESTTLSDCIRNIFYGRNFIDVDDNFVFQGIFSCDINAIKRNRILKPVNLDANSILNSEGKPKRNDFTKIDSEKELISIEVYSRKIIVPEGELIEFYFNDITSISKVEMEKAENKIKSLFLAKISHEFKTPLITIIYILKNYISKEKAEKSNELSIDDVEESLQKFPKEKEKSSLRKYSYEEENYIFNIDENKINYKNPISSPHKNSNGNKNNVISKKNNDNYIKNIIDLSNYMLSLINDIIDFSVIDSSFDLKFQFDSFDLHKMLNFGFRIMKILIDCKGLGRFIQPIIEIDENVPQMFYSDEMRIKQVLLNLVSNSIKFTRRGFIKISAKLIDIGTVEISIEDTGIGISPQDLNKLFMDFGKLQNDESLKLNKMGSGLGLSICRKIVSTLGTNIKVESQQNIKTKFFFGISNKNLRKISNISNASKSLIGSNNLNNIKNIEYGVIRKNTVSTQRENSYLKNNSYNDDCEKNQINKDIKLGKKFGKKDNLDLIAKNSLETNILKNPISNFIINEHLEKNKEKNIKKLDKVSDLEDHIILNNDNNKIKKNIFSELNIDMISKNNFNQNNFKNEVKDILSYKNNYTFDDGYHQIILYSDNIKLDSLINNHERKNKKSLKLSNKNNNKNNKNVENQYKRNDIKSNSLGILYKTQNSPTKMDRNIIQKFSFENKEIIPNFIKSYSKLLFPSSYRMSDNFQSYFYRLKIFEIKRASINIENDSKEEYKEITYLNNKYKNKLINKEKKILTEIPNKYEIFNKDKLELHINLNDKNEDLHDSIFCYARNSFKNVSESYKYNIEKNLRSDKSVKTEAIINKQKLKECEDTILESPKEIFYFDLINEKIFTNRHGSLSNLVNEPNSEYLNNNYNISNN